MSSITEGVLIQQSSQTFSIEILLRSCKMTMRWFSSVFLRMVWIESERWSGGGGGLFVSRRDELQVSVATLVVSSACMVTKTSPLTA